MARAVRHGAGHGDALITSDRPEEVHYGSDGIEMNKPAAGRTGYIKMCPGHVVLLIRRGRESIPPLPGAASLISLDKRNVMLCCVPPGH